MQIVAKAEGVARTAIYFGDFKALTINELRTPSNAELKLCLLGLIGVASPITKITNLWIYDMLGMLEFGARIVPISENN